jgi:uncharacterized membrane protein YhhN
MIIIGAALLLGGLLYFENREGRWGLLLTKTALSSLFIVAALVQPHPISEYYRFVLLGLLFSLCGDVFLALPQKRMFLWGLASFLIGHVFYILGFFHVARTTPWNPIGYLIVLILSGWVCRWLWPHLGSLKIPVLIYVIIITFMVCGAWSVFVEEELRPSGRIMVIMGAVGFYFSDVFVALDRFLKKEFFNRLVGLPLYYTGQFLLAFSIGLLK